MGENCTFQILCKVLYKNLYLIREKTESISIPILIHGLYDRFIVFITGDWSTYFMFIGWGIAWIFFFPIFIKKYKEKKTVELEIDHPIKTV